MTAANSPPPKKKTEKFTERENKKGKYGVKKKIPAENGEGDLLFQVLHVVELKKVFLEAEEGLFTLLLQPPIHILVKTTTLQSRAE